MSIFKATFPEGVKKQLTARQDKIIKRDFEAIKYLNSRTAWIRMTSAVNVGASDTSDGTNDLALKNILLGGALYNNAPRQGVGLTGAEAYSIQTSSGNKHRLGIRPMPGITGIDIKNKGAYGSLREITVNFNCWDIKQLEELELLYMRPGYSVLVEWGWVPYLDNNGKLSTIVDLTDDVLTGGKTKEDIWKNILEKSTKDGNYDAIYGFIKNYSWSVRDDGGYDCTTSLITMGEILESLKVNYGSYDTDINSKGVFNKLDSSKFAKGEPVNKSYSQNKLAGVLNELWTIAKEEISVGVSLTTGAVGSKNIELNGETYNFFRYDLEVEGRDASAVKDSFVEDDAQIYITLKGFVDILNKHILLADTVAQKPIVAVSVTEGAHNGGTEGDPLLCLGNKFQLSVDPSICQIKNMAWTDLKNLGLDQLAEDKDTDTETLKAIMNTLDENYFLDGDYDDKQLGIIGNIYVNLGYLYSLIVNSDLASQDSKEKRDINLYDFLKNITSGISTSIGNVATLDVFVDPVDSVARIIDLNYVDKTNRQEAYDNCFVLEVHNLRSTVRSYKLESQIFPDQTTTISIGAQVKGGALGSDNNTLLDFNRGLLDRIIPKKEAPPIKIADETDDDLKEKLSSLKTNLGIILSFINKTDPNWYEHAGEYNVSDSSKYANALKDIINFYKSIIKDNNKNRSIIPTKLSVDMDGIGGIIIGNLFRIPDDLLPKGYKGEDGIGSKIAYVVTEVGASIQNNDWVTKLNAQFIILDEPGGDEPSVWNEALAKVISAISSTDDVSKATEEVKRIIANNKESTYTPGSNKGNVQNYNKNNSGKQTPNSIVLHCTAGYGSALSTVNFVNQKLSIHYAVDREGNVVQGLDENLIGWHANNKNPGSIGIEIGNIFSGYEKNGKIYTDATNAPLAKGTGTTMINAGFKWNGREWFEDYTAVQITALETLIKGILQRNPGIKLNFTKDRNTIYKNVFGFPGIPEDGKSYFPQKPNGGKGATKNDAGIFTHVICDGSGHGDPPPTYRIINMLQRIAPN